ncbi:hypothetical protein THAOC_35879 [Thalassiosira oceanica]|uniref:Protein YIF1 n=1 Tax=Thalassiosira oceanica TaxID=159749 RepID=K0R137_THAOC|nr:hypothetical protein THAOC_35879 [Thalassiosira oceanica]|mmetsp:Transcript_34680/g.82891  ORF Transcript_34680/g.82891 Transcript_34680/m.82891 type:complete len:343 (+) Transcript_34680:182-1210(+)|eukprot:EJK45505.1 hypothetical protein THAOC_35879 [Thalassiosira oceanica]
MSGFYEGGYSAYGQTGNTGGANAGSTYTTNTASSSGNAFGSGGMGSSAYPSQQSAQQPMQQQGYNQASSAAPAASNPNGMDNLMSNVFNPANIAMAANAAKVIGGGNVDQAAKDFLDDGWAKLIPFLERSLIALRPYFALDNGYVKRKMFRVLFPFLHKQWAREIQEQNPDLSVVYASPLVDDNAPDLYIPSMSLLTYVLLCALCYGNAGKFEPEVMPDICSKCLVTQILEMIAIRIGFYLMEAPVGVLDLACYTGYKYLGLCVNMLMGIVGGYLLEYGHRAYYFTYLWTATAVSFFILKVMANCIPKKVSSTGPKRQFMVLGFAASQFATCWFVSQTKFLD